MDILLALVRSTIPLANFAVNYHRMLNVAVSTINFKIIRKWMRKKMLSITDFV